MKTNIRKHTQFWWHCLQCKDVQSTAACKHKWRPAKAILLWFVVIICGGGSGVETAPANCFCLHRQGDLQSIWGQKVHMQGTGVLKYGKAVIRRVLFKLPVIVLTGKWRQVKVLAKNKYNQELIYPNGHKSPLVNQWKTPWETVKTLFSTKNQCHLSFYQVQT